MRLGMAFTFEYLYNDGLLDIYIPGICMSWDGATSLFLEIDVKHFRLGLSCHFFLPIWKKGVKVELVLNSCQIKSAYFK